jgi:hypothetical protein
MTVSFYEDPDEDSDRTMYLTFYLAYYDFEGNLGGFH